jgi:hypothetical protein
MPHAPTLTAPVLASLLAAEIPYWCTCTIVVRDALGELIGHGVAERTRDGAVVSVTSSGPSDWTPLVEAHAGAGG